jgi:hypothetical protein
MKARTRPRRGPTRIRFATEGRRRVVTVEGGVLPEIAQQRLRRLLRPLPIQHGTVTIRRDWSGRQRVTFTSDIPESTRQVIRNIVGNLTRLRPV